MAPYLVVKMRTRLLAISAFVSCYYNPHPLGYCDYYLLSAYEVMMVLDYYINIYVQIIWLLLYASLNKLRFHLLLNSRLSTTEVHCLIK